MRVDDVDVNELTGRDAVVGRARRDPESPADVVLRVAIVAEQGAILRGCDRGFECFASDDGVQRDGVEGDDQGLALHGFSLDNSDCALVTAMYASIARSCSR